MKSILLMFALIVAAVALGDEYHTFTSQDGQTVTAKIMAVSSYTGKIKLERETGKQVWVSMDMLSSEDQAFIQAWGEKKSMPKTPKPKEPGEEESEGTEAKMLTKTEIRNIAKQYKKAWERKDYVLWSSLLEMHKGHHLLNERTFNSHDVKSVMLRTIDRVSDGYNIDVEYNMKVPKNFQTESSGTAGLMREHHGWLQILPDGRIKYTPILFKHPMYAAMDNLHDMFPYCARASNLPEKEYMRVVNNGINNLKRMGIPCFGYDIKNSESKRNATAKLILSWMIYNSDRWDETEPKIACPEDVFKAKLLQIKKIK